MQSRADSQSSGFTPFYESRPRATEVVSLLSQNKARGRHRTGFTIIEVLITTFIIGTVVTGVFGLFFLSLRSSQEAERRVVAVALANEKMEMVRNLPYVDVGTDGGVPAGSIPQEETIQRNGLDYLVKTDIRYIDDTYDGESDDPTNGVEQITVCHRPDTSAEHTVVVSNSSWDAHQAHGDYQGACGTPGEGTGEGDEYNADYKQVRVEVSWNDAATAAPILLITYVVPPGIEGGELGGTLDLQVLDAAGDGVPSADVHLVNDAVSPAVDLNTTTDSSGRLVLPGLDESADSYELTVSKSGFTTEQTYDSTASFIPNPDHSHLSMIVRTITSKTFAIDQIASLNVNTFDDLGDALGNIAYTLRGTKTIGVDDSGENIYTIDRDSATDGLGASSEASLVWDSYDFLVDGDATGYDIKETSLLLPISIAPGDTPTVDVTLVPHTALSLHVSVVTSAGDPIDNATVHLTGNSVDDTDVTGAVGQVFFEDLPTTGTYTIEVDASGYDLSTQDISLTESQRIRVELAESV